ncbi:SDR family NAD(P)-dependent oxidoreductase [Candidatus Frankia nodulisporulans]|uniref:SDR family NAD(P)-dependent oxidoreductase n=1 Tax=Candidatus Frankia nodulisporulans TaxID=2060052 RepID=UPI0013D652D5|nr:SDR family NAD(P)-dependent oxidoreductase [Candidatus Frankia nodulisporulans]
MDLTGRSAIVTGGAGGLGAATVRHLVGLGVKTVVFDLHDGGTKEVADSIGPDALAVSGDINDDDVVRSAISAAQSLGTFSIVVNVAGGGIAARTLNRDGTPHDKDSFVRVLQLNAVGTFNVTRLSAAAIAHNTPTEDGERGVIVNTASIAGLEGQVGQLAYAAAKAAILGMSLPLARDLAPSGIRVNAIAPGTMGTPIMLSAPEGLKEKLTSNIQFPKRMGRPEEFALLVESIVRNPYLNGENIRLDGALRFPPK